MIPNKATPREYAKTLLRNAISSTATYVLMERGYDYDMTEREKALTQKQLIKLSDVLIMKLNIK